MSHHHLPRLHALTRSHLFPRHLALATTLLALLASAALQPALHAAPNPAPPAYKGAIVIDNADGAVLYEDNADIITPPASVTKLMTFLIIHDAIAAGKIALTTPVRATKDETRFAMKRGSTSVWLNEKETYPVEELIHAMMIRSANDAALVLSRAVAGTTQAFVASMNTRAHSLGMTRTKFVTPHGLNTSSVPVAEGDLTTPRDLAILTRHLIANTDILKYTSIRTRKFGEGRRRQPVVMVNHNNLLEKVAGVDGLKTGYTEGAGYCLAATAERNNRRLIIVTMGSPDARTRDLQIAALFDHYFAAPPASPVSPAPPLSPPSRPSTPQPSPPSASTPSAPSAPAQQPAATPASEPPPANAAAAQSTAEIPKIVFPAPPVSSGARKK
jgi:D-alanyl-D-alanine carboxypeptidase (penicillin-binding protein 5/6)